MASFYSRLMIRIIHAGLVAASFSVLLLQANCDDSSRDAVEPDDLVGTWREATTGVTLTFNRDSGGQTYVAHDPQGAYSQIHEGGSDLLFQGFWMLTGSSLFLEDEAGPGSCPLDTDRYVVIMNGEKTSMVLTHVSDECEFHDLVLADRAWQRQTEES
ncbi:MAG: hypothetical protein JSW54_07690 [Fidelibacterota bacterium]|nr:MAG: hypothetical protein JSW54_07690 [Candidatus Neomarinimicrobiota bacterium]